MLEHKTNFNKFKKTEFTSRIFSNHNAMKLEINHIKIKILPKKWRFNNMTRNNEYANNETKKGIKRYLETHENENTITPNLWGTAHAVLRGKCIASQAYLKKQEKSQLNNLTLHFKKLRKDQCHPKSAEGGKYLQLLLLVHLPLPPTPVSTTPQPPLFLFLQYQPFLPNWSLPASWL